MTNNVRNKYCHFSPELFENPPVQFRGSPFWAWNSDLDPDELTRQIAYFQEMGFGGFHMHARAGLSLPYMSEAYLQRVQLCVEQAKKAGLVPRLYDEDTWPSGFAGGRTVQGHPEYRRRQLHFCRKEKSDACAIVGRYDIRLHADGTLASYRLLREGEKAADMLWVAQILVDKDSSRYGQSAYIDTLRADAVCHFIELTHDTYRRKLGKDFGTTVPSIFTDEPRAPEQSLLADALEDGEAIFPWTDSFPQSFKQATECDIVEALPELVWDLEGHRPSKIRWLFYDHVAELFAKSYFDTIGEWCKNNGIDFVGHLMAEFPMQKSVAISGEAMRCYRGMDIPGIDMLCGLYEYTTAKQAQSVARQMKKKGMLSELYGVIGWDGDFREHKLQGDWQAALGVTLRVPHLAWYSMKGPGKRDYPQSIFYQSPWFREYPLIENHFARVNMAMTQGNPVCHVGVIHPVESFWLHCGPLAQSRQAMEKIDQNWQKITQWLLFSGYDFDFISESMLPQLCDEGTAPLQVGACRYDVILVPGCETIRSTTLSRLQQFQASGGTLIFLGQIPSCVDAMPSTEPKKLAQRVQCIPFEKDAVAEALAPFREVALCREDGTPITDLLYQLREDSSGRWLFVAHGKKPGEEDSASVVRLELKGRWKVELYDTVKVKIVPLTAAYGNDQTVLTVTMYAHDSLLLRLTARMRVGGEGDRKNHRGEDFSLVLPERNEYTLSEPNAMLLDMAQYRLDEEPWQPLEEILRLYKRCRYKLNWHSGGVQPWLIPDEPAEHTLSLRFHIESTVAKDSVLLALENRETTRISWNGENIFNSAAGWYVDHDIQTVLLPNLREGENMLELSMPFGKKTTTEWCYLLGDFGVRVCSGNKMIVDRADSLTFHSIVEQGLPFYSGEVTYHIPVEIPKDGTLYIRIPSYNAALMKCHVDDGQTETIAFAPYEAKIRIHAGKHTLHLTAYINRTNGFGPVHHTEGQSLLWCGPDAWQSTGEAWTYNYVLREEGVLRVPTLTLEIEK